VRCFRRDLGCGFERGWRWSISVFHVAVVCGYSVEMSGNSFGVAFGDGFSNGCDGCVGFRVA
jgi:hypothetical protein